MDYTRPTSVPGADLDPGGVVRALAAQLANPTALLEKAGALLTDRAQAAFREQRRGTEVWPPRAVPNVLGILQDLDAWREPPKRRFEPTPAGVDWGHTRDSIAWTVTGPNEVTVGTTSGHGGAVQMGDEVDVTLDDTLKAILGGYLDRESHRLSKAEKRAKKTEEEAMGFGPKAGNYEAAIKAQKAFDKLKAGGRSEMLEKAFRWMLAPTVKGFTAEVPARPFLMVTPEDEADLEVLLVRELVLQVRKN